MDHVSLVDAFATPDGKEMFVLSKLATPDVPLMACAPMGPVSVQTVKKTFLIENQT